MINNFLCLQYSNFRVGELALWKKYTVPIKPCTVVAIFKKSFFVLFNATAEPINHFVFWKNLQKHFCNLIYKKKLGQTHWKFTATFIGDNLLIGDIALRNWDLSIIGIAQGLFEVIDYRYCCSAERFIMPITVGTVAIWGMLNTGMVSHRH